MCVFHVIIGVWGGAMCVFHVFGGYQPAQTTIIIEVWVARCAYFTCLDGIDRLARNYKIRCLAIGKAARVPADPVSRTHGEG